MNKYNIDLNVEGIETKKRYTQIEKAKRTLALVERVDDAIKNFKADLLESVNALLKTANESNCKDVVKRANVIVSKITKILSK